MSTAALFIGAKKWKPSKCPSTHEWINKMCFHMMKHHTTIKSNEVLIHPTTGVNPEHFKRKEMVAKDHIAYDSIHMKYPG